MYQDRGIDHGRIERSVPALYKKDIAQQEGKEQADYQPQHTCQQGDDEVLSQYLSQQFHACAAKGTTHPDFRYPAAQAALRHAAQVDGRHDEQDEEDDETGPAGSRHIRLHIGAGYQGILLLVVRTVAVDNFITVLAYHLIEFVQPPGSLLADGREVAAVARQDGATHQAHQVVLPRVVHLVGRGIGNPHLRVGRFGQC